MGLYTNLQRICTFRPLTLLKSVRCCLCEQKEGLQKGERICVCVCVCVCFAALCKERQSAWVVLFIEVKDIFSYIINRKENHTNITL
jgi:hypothetical protein